MAKPLEPKPDALAPFTTALRDQQPEGSYAAVYTVGDHRLVWLAATHATRTDSATFRLVKAAYGALQFDTVLVEGCPTTWGPSPQRLIDFARQGLAEERDGFQQRGETVPTVLGAVEQGATVLCGEPDDAQIAAFVLGQGLQPEDLLGFYTLRSIPQWIRERRITDASDTRIGALLTEELAKNRGRLAMDPSVLPTIEAWHAWYEATNGKPLAADFTTEEAGPLADGPFGSNGVGAAISRARAVHLHDLVIARLAAGETVLVVYGASHFMIHRPALREALGQLCFVGDLETDEGAQACF